MNQSTFDGVKGTKLFFRSWHPRERPRGVVVIVPGFNAHSGYYEWVAEQLTRDGLTVYALDLRGRGQSEGERFYVESFADYVGDVAKFIALGKSREPGLPVYLLGHSAGGVVACTYALEHQSELSGLICESFAFQVPAPDFALTVLKGLSHLLPRAHVLKLHNQDFSRDPRAVAAMDADPLIADESQPTQTVAAMVRADERLAKELPRIELPVLILHGTLDRAAKPSGSQFFYEQAGSKDKTLKLYEGFFHDLLNDQDKQLVMNDILTWLNARLPASDARVA